MIRKLVKRLLPAVYWTYKLKRLERMEHEVETSLLPLLTHPQRLSLDIGASNGIYAVKLARLSSRCVAFEPRSSSASDLRALAYWSGLAIDVEEVALSDSRGLAHLRILVQDPGRSTIENTNTFADENSSEVTETNVTIRRLDDYDLTNVGFIKIDVEGHELAVLKGAMSLLETERPTLLIEAENRHRPNAVADLNNFLVGNGYRGFFVHGKHFQPMDQFVQEVHQNPANIGGWRSGWKRSGVYINNFVYIPEYRSAELVAGVKSILCADQHEGPHGN